MKHNISILTSTILVAILLGGCNAPQKPTKPILPISKTIKKVNEVKKLSYKKKDKNGKLFTEEDILKKIASKEQGMLKLLYGKKNVRTKNPIFKIYYDTNFGIKVEHKAMDLVATFHTQSCEKFFTAGGNNRYTCKKATTMKYYSSVKFIEKKDRWDIRISSVSRYETNAPANTSYYSEPAKLIKAVNKSLSTIKDIVIPRKEKVEFKGSIYSKYPIPAIKSSFDRSLKAYKDKKSMVDGYTNSYLVKIDNKEYYIHIKIFPYKAGNKVAYILDDSYDANKISKVSFKKKLDKLIKDKVTSIINM